MGQNCVFFDRFRRGEMPNLTWGVGKLSVLSWSTWRAKFGIYLNLVGERGVFRLKTNHFVPENAPF